MRLAMVREVRMEPGISGESLNIVEFDSTSKVPESLVVYMANRKSMKVRFF
jgi:hypothetical protein